MTETLDRNSTSFTREGGILHDDSGALFTRSLTAPTCGAGYAERRDGVRPERLRVGFAFDQHDEAGSPRLGQPSEAVQLRLGPDLPTEALGAIECQAEAD